MYFYHCIFKSQRKDHSYKITFTLCFFLLSLTCREFEEVLKGLGWPFVDCSCFNASIGDKHGRTQIQTQDTTPATSQATVAVSLSSILKCAYL